MPRLQLGWLPVAPELNDPAAIYDLPATRSTEGGYL